MNRVRLLSSWVVVRLVFNVMVVLLLVWWCRVFIRGCFSENMKLVVLCGEKFWMV